MLTTGFMVVAHPTGIEFRSYTRQREVGARLLSFAEDGALSLLLMGSLYYRGDQVRRLRGRVDASTFDRCRESDASLAHALYKTGGTAGLCRLEGDFVLACHDRSTHRVVALRDPMGAYPLFWVHQGDTLALSTSIHPLLDRLRSVAVDPEYLVDYLAFPTDATSELPSGRTAYRNVQRLLPGCLLEADLSTRRVVCRPYWNWREEAAERTLSSVQEAGDLVREILEAAVRERLSRQAHTGCHFSGGYDSTGVALLASRLTKMHGQPLHALSFVYRRDPILSREQEYIRCALEKSEAIVHHEIPADDLLDFVDYRRVPLLDEPSPLLGARFGLQDAIAQTAAGAGVDTMLTGDGADHLFAPLPESCVAEFLMQRRVRHAFRLASRYARLSGQSPWTISTDALKLLLPLALRDGIGPFLKRGRTNFEALSERTIPPWFSGEFIRQHRLRRRILGRQSAAAQFGLLTAGDIALAAGDWNNWHIGLPNGVVIRRPYWDPRLVKLTLGLPTSLHAEPGRAKPVLAAALNDVLPEKIIARNGKTNLNILNDGLALNQRALEAMIHEAPIDDGIFDRTALIDSLAKAACGVYREAIAVGRLRIALSYLMWASTRADWMREGVGRDAKIWTVRSRSAGCQPAA